MNTPENTSPIPTTCTGRPPARAGSGTPGAVLAALPSAREESFLARDSHHPNDKMLGEHTMMKTGNTLPHGAQGDTVKSELLAILDRVVEAKYGLSEIYRLLDKATTMSEIRARFARWQAEQRGRTIKDHS
jgi:hypothetical protein